MRLAAILVAALASASALTMPTTAAATITLAPGEPLDHRTVQELLAPEVADVAGGEHVRMIVAAPRLPLNNPYAAPAVLAVTGVHLTGDDGWAATVSISVDGAAPLSLHLSGALRRLVAVPVPRADIPAGHRLDPAQFETLWLAPNRVRGEWLVSRDGLAAAEAHRTLVAGRPVDAEAIGPPRLVRRGERVTVVVADRGLRLEVTGTARADGGIGDIVDVRNDRSGRIVRGEVRGPSRIHVELP